jgi:hypothetical protein
MGDRLGCPEVSLWLDPSADPADAMMATPLGLAVNNPRNDGPEFLTPA